MKKPDFSDGICETCGNTGLAGERCLTCGGMLAKIEPETTNSIEDEELSKDSPEVYPLEVLDQEASNEDSEEDLNLKND